MSKAHEFQRFKHALRIDCDRPSLLVPMFEQGLTPTQAREQLERFAGTGIALFKRAARGAKDQPTKRVERITTLAEARRIAARGALKALEGTYWRRMTPQAKEWCDSQVNTLRRLLAR